MNYGVARLNKNQLKGIIENVDLSAAAYPIPRNLRERLENNIFPRFYEINDEIDSVSSLPNELGVEISKLNQEDILYGLESSSITKMLTERGFNTEDLRNKIKETQFLKY